MDSNKLFLIIRREFLIRVKKRSFLIMTILTPLLFAALMVVPAYLSTLSSGEKGRRVLIIDNSGVTAPYFESNEQYIFDFDDSADVDEVKRNFQERDIYAMVEISSLDAGMNVSVTAISSKQLSMELKRQIERSVQKAIESKKLEQYDISDLDTILREVKTTVSVKSLTIGKDGKEKQGMVELYMGIAYVLCMIMYFFIFMFGSMVMRGVIEEKTNRIVEVIISSVKPFYLMLGKIIGIAAVALLQFTIWIVLTFGIVTAFQSALFSVEDVANQLATDNMHGEMIDMTAGLHDEGDFGGLLGALSEVPVVNILTGFVIYLLLGYLLYASMFAAIGSAVDNETDTQQLILPITIPLVIGLFIMMHTCQYPDSSLSFWGSVIPFTSPMVMVARIPFGVPLWELGISITVLFLTFLLMTLISGKIYRVGILSYGKKGSWREMVKWIRY